jgi:hypothetical protein
MVTIIPLIYDLERILLHKAMEYYALLSPMKNRDFHRQWRLQLDTKVRKKSRLINVLYDSSTSISPKCKLYHTFLCLPHKEKYQKNRLKGAHEPKANKSHRC